jgi:hypothetical protein
MDPDASKAAALLGEFKRGNLFCAQASHWIAASPAPQDDGFFKLPGRMPRAMTEHAVFNGP